MQLEQSNRFDPFVKDMNKASSAPSTNKTTSLNELKFVSLNINGIRGKNLELLAFLDYHKPDIVAIQETKIDSSIQLQNCFLIPAHTMHIRGSCKTFCHWVRITSVLRLIKHIFITNLQSIPPLLKHIFVTFLPSREKQINSLLLVSVGDTDK